MTADKAVKELFDALIAARAIIRKTRSSARSMGCVSSIPYRELGEVQQQITKALSAADKAR